MKTLLQLLFWLMTIVSCITPQGISENTFYSYEDKKIAIQLELFSNGVFNLAIQETHVTCHTEGFFSINNGKIVLRDTIFNSDLMVAHLDKAMQCNLDSSTFKVISSDKILFDKYILEKK